MNWLESLLYGLVSGFTEFLPVSSAAHQAILKRLFGAELHTGFQDFLVHIAVLIVLCVNCRSIFSDINSRVPVVGNRKKGRSRHPADFRVVRTAVVPMLLGFVLVPFIDGFHENLLLLVLFCAINGLILFAHGRMYSGNKDARSMSGWDSLLIGLGSALAVFPGISRVGVGITVAAGRGADKQRALDWALLLSIPAIAVLIILDLFFMFKGGFGLDGILGFLKCLLAAAGAGCGSYFGIMLMRFLSVKTGISGFAFYSWGAALFCGILYLTVV